MSNLLTVKEKKSILGLYRKRFLSIIFISFIVIAVIGSALLFPSLFYLENNKAVLSLNKKSLQGQETTKIAETLAGTITDINAHLNVFSDTTITSPVIAHFIDPILKTKTGAIHVTNFSYVSGEKNTNASIQISGIADTRSDLLAFADKIKTLDGFKTVSVPIASFIKDTKMPFTVSATIVF